MFAIGQYHVFAVKFEFDQSVREFIAQDESRQVGVQRVETTYKVLCTNEEYAIALVRDRFKFHNPYIVSVVREEIQAIILDYSLGNSSDPKKIGEMIPK